LRAVARVARHRIKDKAVKIIGAQDVLLVAILVQFAAENAQLFPAQIIVMQLALILLFSFSFLSGIPHFDDAVALLAIGLWLWRESKPRAYTYNPDLFYQYVFMITVLMIMVFFMRKLHGYSKWLSGATVVVSLALAILSDMPAAH